MGQGEKTGEVHVIFDEGGRPAWFGPAPVAGSEPIDLAELMPHVPAGLRGETSWPIWRDILISHCRIDGRWAPRARPDPVGATEPAPTDPEAGPEPEAGDQSGDQGDGGTGPVPE